MSGGPATADVLIGIGSNVDAAANVPAAVTRLAEVGEVVAVSAMVESAPVGRTDQPAFTNGAARVRTGLSTAGLKAALRRIESDLGRVRDPADPDGPRTIDLDIVVGPDGRADDDLFTRWFVAGPCAEVWADWRAADGRTIREVAEGLGP